MNVPAANPTVETIFQPNQVFADEAEMHQWLQVNVPGAVVLKTWKVERICCQVKYWPRTLQLPKLCAASNLYSFPDWKSAEKFNDDNGHFPILARWRCRVCQGWHYWSMLVHSNSSGELPAGATVEVPDRIKQLIRQTALPETATV
jgi:hypothetical protein